MKNVTIIMAIVAASISLASTQTAAASPLEKAQVSSSEQIDLSARKRRSRSSFSCGREMSAIVGVESTPLARDWAVKFPRTSAREGAVVVQSRRGMDSSGKRRGGHVSLIVRMVSSCRAIVRDNRGQPYERDICKNIIAYVDPNGNRLSRMSSPAQDRFTMN